MFLNRPHSEGTYVQILAAATRPDRKPGGGCLPAINSGQNSDGRRLQLHASAWSQDNVRRHEGVRLASTPWQPQTLRIRHGTVITPFKSTGVSVAAPKPVALRA
jgi:hypothetical protein